MVDSIEQRLKTALCVGFFYIFTGLDPYFDRVVAYEV